MTNETNNVPSTENKEAEKEIGLLQAKCEDMVKVVEQNSEERLAKEKAVHEQKLEELEKQLAQGQARLKELEQSWALEKASSTDPEVIINKEVKTGKVFTQPTELPLTR